MKNEIKVGQFWKNTLLSCKIAEIVEVNRQTDKLINAKVRVWVQVKPQHLHLVKKESQELKVFSSEFSYWKLVDIDIE